ncbi:MAG: SDR family NAD(P)-dependent oxidoreductase, partial [Pseudonocardia sp.]|nr:SDR family NAD(P)-dependent oxidoreductase [Pseudonocardia sp.]
SVVFAERMAECERALAPFVDWSLRNVLADEAMLQRADVVQPVLWAVMVSLAAVWGSVGVVPDVVVGHSQGEIAAAVVAGGLSLEGGARVVAVRSRVIGRVLAGRGGMVSVSASRVEVEGWLGPWAEWLSVAAVNGPGSVVVSGEMAALDEFVGWCEASEVRARRIAVDYASHSVMVEEVREELAELLGDVVARVPEVAWWSTVTGECVRGAVADGGYWYRNLREPVRFADVVGALVADGFRVFVEPSPHPVLTFGAHDTAEQAGVDVTVIPTLRRDMGGLDALQLALGQAWVSGVHVDWLTMLPGHRNRSVDLPTYAFQHRHYWLPMKSVVDGGSELTAPTSDAELDDWQYRVDWTQLTPRPDIHLHGAWLVIGSSAQTGDDHIASIVRWLAASGATPVLITLSDSATDRVAAAQTVADAVGDLTAVSGALSLLALDERPHAQHTFLPVGIAGTLALIQALGDLGLEAPLWCATLGAVSVGDGDPVASPAQQLAWGLGRVAALEYPRRWGGLVDLPATLNDSTGVLLRQALAGRDAEDQVAVRATGLFGRRLVRTELPAEPSGGPWRPEGTTLITGGTGGIGTQLAAWLAARGAERVVLMSRRGLAAPGAPKLVARVTALGTNVTVVECDVADAAALKRVVDQLRADGHDIRTVLHAAASGVLVPLSDTDLTEFADTVRGKMAGAVNLDAIFEDSVTDFVLFSSISGVWGSAVHGAYAASNAFLDGLAEHRRSLGHTATSIAWGIWDPAGGGGMAAALAEDRLRAQGIPFMSPATALDGLGRILGGDQTVAVCAAVDWNRFAPVFTSVRPSRLIGDLPDVRRILGANEADQEDGNDASAALRSRLRNLSDVDRLGKLVELVREQATRVLGYGSPDEIAANRAFRDLGFDSLTAVSMRDRLGTVTGLSLPVTVVFDHSSVSTLARHLRDKLFGAAHQANAVVATPAVVTAVTDPGDSIAIVGMACRYPGNVRSPEDLWQLLVDGRDAYSELPLDRGWDVDEMYHPDPDQPGRSYLRGGYFLHDAAWFDPAFFGISPREALAMDPQQRLAMELAWESFERAGIPIDTMHGEPVGVFVGAAYQGYGGDPRQAGADVEAHIVAGISTSVLSGRVSYAFGLEGPAITVDTACSSSLVAIHLAAQALRHGECTMALAGGVTVMGAPLAFATYSRQRALAMDGRSKAFAAE